MKRLLSVLIIVLGVQNVHAQQYPEFQLYMLNPAQVNPGFTGYLTDLSIFAGAVSPLTFSEHAVRNYYVSVNQSFENNYLGIGGKLLYDQRDFYESFYMDASTSYRAVIANKQVVSIGADIGLVNRSYRLGNLTPYVNMDDPTLSSDYYYQTSFKLGVGLAYYSPKLELGVSMPYLIEGSEDFSGYFNAYAAYKWYFANDQWVVQPNAFWEFYPDETMNLRANVMMKLRGVLWGQVGSDVNRSVYLSSGWTFGNYELIYGHKLQSGDAVAYSNRAEVMIRVHLGRSNRELSHIATPLNKKR